MENIDLIRKIAWSFHNSTGIDFDDLVQEGVLAYLEASGPKQKVPYDSSKAALSTYMWFAVGGALKNYIKRIEKPHWDVLSLDEIDFNPVDPNHLSFLDNLTNDAQKLLDIVFSDILKYSLLPAKQARKELRKEALRKQDYSWIEIKNGLHELKLAFK